MNKYCHDLFNHSSMKILQHNKGDMPPDIKILKNKFLFDNSHQINNFIVHKQKFQSISLTFCDLFETQNLPQGPPDIENSGSRKSASHHQTIEEKQYVIKVDQQILQ